MNTLTDQNVHILKWLRDLPHGHVNEHSIPNHISRDSLDYLVTHGLVRNITLVPPGREGFEHGLAGFVITDAGKDILSAEENVRESVKQKIANDHARQDAQKARDRLLRKKDIRRSWLHFFLGLLLGYLIGWLNPLAVFNAEIVRRAVVDFAISLFH